MHNLLKLILIVSTSFFSNFSTAESVCIKNKSGVVEMWQVTDKSHVDGIVPCPANITLPVKPNQTTNTSTPALSQTQTSPVNSSSSTPVESITHLISASKEVSLPWSSKSTDLNIRMLIDSWSARANWKLVWAVDKDVPLISEINVSGDFKSAIRQVLDATVLSDIALKPCFYTNNVVRVVRETTKCNPNE